MCRTGELKCDGAIVFKKASQKRKFWQALKLTVDKKVFNLFFFHILADKTSNKTDKNVVYGWIIVLQKKMSYRKKNIIKNVKLTLSKNKKYMKTSVDIP